MMSQGVTIGRLARETGVKIPTIRYYESIGLLAEAPRTNSNRRVYGGDDLRRLKFIRHARELGFDIPAIKELLALAAEPSRSCHEADSIALAHLGDIDSRIARLKALRREVKRMVEECAHGRIADCRILEALGDHAFCREREHLAPRANFG